MFTNWEQVRAWIEDNNFPHWVFYKTKPEERTDKSNDIIVDSNNYSVSDFEDKLAMTKKYLQMYGGKVYGVGFKTPLATQNGVLCEARLETEIQPAAGVGNSYPALDEDAIAKRVEAKLRAEYERKEYEKLRADLDKERKEFEAEKQSALGAITHYFAPIGQALLQNKGLLRNVAGTDTQAPVTADPVVPIEPTTEDEPFTENEQNKLFDLMAEWKKADPDYLIYLEKIVEMAKNGDSKYTVAKSFL